MWSKDSPNPTECQCNNRSEPHNLMPTRNTSYPVPCLPGRKQSASNLGRLAALGLALALLTGQSRALAQYDNFNDGNDTAPSIEWLEQDALAINFGAPPQCTWSFPGSNTYNLAAIPSGIPGIPGQVSSIVTNVVYTDFYESVDVVSWNVAAGFPVFALLARVSNISTEPGLPTTQGYTFGYVPLGVFPGQPLGPSYVAIARLHDGGSINGVPGSGPGANAQFPITLDPGSSYRLVFMGHGTHMEGRVYALPAVTLLAVVTADTATQPAGEQYSEGNGGLLAFNLFANPITSAASQYAGGVDVTFDNYYASARCPMNVADLVVKDNFNDGNDTAPTVAWQHYDPISTVVGFGQNTWTFPGGNTYRLEAPPQPFDPQLGQGRVASTTADVQTDFRIAADIVNWDDTIRQNIGLMARLSSIGLGSTAGYTFTYDVGGSGDMDISRVDGEVPTGLTLSGSDRMKMIPGNAYRFVFSGKGSELRALVFELPNTMTPLIDCVASDTNYASGVAGLLGSAADAAATADVTFDNWSDTAQSAPAVTLTIGTAGGNVAVSWPFNPDCIWVLQSCPDLSAVPVWTDVTTGSNPTDGHLVIAPESFQTTYTANSPISATEHVYYRLKQL